MSGFSIGLTCAAPGSLSVDEAVRLARIALSDPVCEQRPERRHRRESFGPRGLETKWGHVLADGTLHTTGHPSAETSAAGGRRHQPGTAVDGENRWMAKPSGSHTSSGIRSFTLACPSPSSASCARAEDAQDVADALLTAGGEPEQVGAPDHDRLRAERERLDRVRAAPYATVQKDIDLVADGLGDGGQRPDRGRRRVDVVAAVIPLRHSRAWAAVGRTESPQQSIPAASDPA
jgi:hypothetical protein